MNLACETRWSSYRNAFNCVLQNLDIMRNIALTTSHLLKEDILKLLQDQEFESKLNETVY